MSNDAPINLYPHYAPSILAAIMLSAIFSVLIIWHLWKIVRSRCWFGLSIVLAGLLTPTASIFLMMIIGVVEVVGCGARAYGHNHLFDKTPFIVQTLLILLAPILIAAGIYMFLGRLIHVTGHPQLSFIRLNWLTKIFVLGDVFCFLVQAAGASKLVNTHDISTIRKSQNVILVGLGLQVLFFAFFMLCAIVFHVRVASARYIKTIDPSLRLHSRLLSLYTCSLLVTVRNVYRLIEYKSGPDGYIQIHEWPTYGLDVALMAIVIGITISWYTAISKGVRNIDGYSLQPFNLGN